MRKTIYYIVMILLVIAQTVTAAPAKKNTKSKGKSQTKEWKGSTRNIHHVAFWGGAGYSGLVNHYNYNRFVGGGGGLLGVGYEYRYNHFILNAGSEFRIFSSMDNISFPASYDVAMMADGYTQTKHYTFANPMRENHVVGQVMLPIMAGGKWQMIYFLAGAKIGYTLFGSYSQNGAVTTTITDEQAYDPQWGNMPAHDVTSNVPYTASGRNNYGLDATISAEVGVDINYFLSQEWNKRNNARKHPLHMRAAVFVDYGLKNLSLTPNGAIASADDRQVYTQSLHTSEWAAGRLNSLLVGVKFTALLQMNKPQPPKPQKPDMVLFVTDTYTHKAIASAGVEITPLEGKNPRPTRRNTNNRGVTVAKLAPGPYHLHLSHPDYLATDHEYSHGDWGDTLSLSMQPRPDYCFFVRDAKSDSLMASSVSFINAANETVIATTATDSLTGKACLRLPINTQIRIRIEAANHFTITQAIEDIGATQTYRLEPIVKKRAIILHNLFFATNETTILPESEPALQDLYDLMAENPELHIRITGHTDNVGSDTFNQTLSEGRANSVRDDLIKRGIAPERIEAEGKGESQPITTNDTEEGRAQNRRVEFMVL